MDGSLKGNGGNWIPDLWEGTKSACVCGLLYCFIGIISETSFLPGEGEGEVEHFRKEMKPCFFFRRP